MIFNSVVLVPLWLHECQQEWPALTMVPCGWTDSALLALLDEVACRRTRWRSSRPVSLVAPGRWFPAVPGRVINSLGELVIVPLHATALMRNYPGVVVMSPILSINETIGFSKPSTSVHSDLTAMEKVMRGKALVNFV
jgi:hypothetical protein